MNQRQITAEAKFRAGLILESVVNAGWATDDSVVSKYGPEDAERISEAVTALAVRLIEQGGTA